MKKILLLFAFILGTLNYISAQHLYPFRNTVSNSYNFWLYTPQGYSDSTLKPLVVFLHGSSLCGSDLNKVRRYGTINAIEMGMKLDAVVVAPQNRGGSWNPDKVWRIVSWAEDHYAIDTNRIYVLGMSLGGYGTIDVAAAYSDRIAAAMALCGGGTSKNLCRLNDMPLWILHGTADRAVGIGASQRVVDAMISCGDGNRLIWTRLQGMNHGQLAYAFYMHDTYDWLFSHSLADRERPVNRTVSLTPSNMNRSVYRSIREGGKVVVHSNTPNVASRASREASSSLELSASAMTIDSTHNLTNSKSKSNSSSPVYYTIKKGDTLSGIARKHHTSVKKLCRLNNISESTTLRVGRRIRVR